MNNPDRSKVFEDEDFLALNKPPRTHFDETIVTQGGEKWVPVHRIDFETSGLLLFSHGPLVALTRALFQNPTSGLRKLYLAGASAPLPPALSSNKKLEGWIGSRYRASKKVRFAWDRNDAFRGWHSVRPCSQIVRVAEQAVPQFTGTPYEVELLTGARHQIRAFFAAADAPLVGDPVYGTAAPDARLELHAWRLDFEHPARPGKKYNLEAPL
ncbi:MAG: hypothetical protein JST16_08750 [Bdellovibrionales bacterium]|nr:hypothetical protein [Bdellovibrionales bacterium]